MQLPNSTSTKRHIYSLCIAPLKWRYTNPIIIIAVNIAYNLIASLPHCSRPSRLLSPLTMLLQLWRRWTGYYPIYSLRTQQWRHSGEVHWMMFPWRRRSSTKMSRSPACVAFIRCLHRPTMLKHAIACPLNESQSLYFVVDRFLMKLFNYFIRLCMRRCQ